MKKLLSLLVVGVVGMSLLSCSSSVVLEEDTTTSIIGEKFDITERDINIDGNYDVYFQGDKLIAQRWLNSYGFEDMFQNYEVDENGNLTEIDNLEYVTTTVKNVEMTSASGITTECDDSNLREDEKEYYYRDTIKDITIKVGGIKEYLNSLRLKSTKDRIDWNVESIGNNKYIIIVFDVALYEGKECTQSNKIFIIETESEKVYEGSLEGDLIQTYYYDNELESILIITKSNKIKKANLTDGKIITEDYMEFNDLGCEVEFIPRNQGIDSSKFVAWLKDKVDDKRTFGVLDARIGEMNILDSALEVDFVVNKHNMVFVTYNGEKYLGQINESNEIDLIYKFDKKYDKDMFVRGSINESGDRIIVEKIYYDNIEHGNESSVSDYSLLELK